jgi:Ca2+-binding EF-hand superfamily protein
MSLHETDILSADDFGGVVALFSELPQRTFHPGPLLRRARSMQGDIGGKLIHRLRGETTFSVTSSGEEQNKERLVRQMVKETHLTEEDINQLHQRFMDLEAKTRKQRQTGKSEAVTSGTNTQGSDKKAKRQRRGSVAGRRRRGSVLQSFKKTDLAEQSDTVYEDRGIGFEGFAELLSKELPQWAGTGDEEKLRGLFHAFDTDSSGKISVAQFIQGVATFTGGDVDKRLQMIFRTVDTDQTGLISHDEMLKLFIDSYAMFFPGMSTAGIPELVTSIFQRLEVEPSHGLNFDEFCVTVKSQPLLLECFSQQALDARAREDEASAERAIALHGLENFESKMMAAVISDGKKAKWKEHYFVLQEGVLSVFADKKSHDKGKRLQRIDLKSGDVRVELQRDGGGKTGLEESLLLQWPEGQQRELRELKMSEPQSYTYDWSKGLKDAATLYRWSQLLSLFTASHDRSTTSAMAEIQTLCAMPPAVLEQLIRALVLDMRMTDPRNVETPTTRNVAGEAARLALKEGLPTVSAERHDAIQACCKQVLSTGGEEQNILAMVRRGVAIDQVRALTLLTTAFVSGPM